MQIVKARYRNLTDFLNSYAGNMPHGGLFVATTAPLEPGSDVMIELACDGLPNKVLIRGTVRSWRPALPRLRIRAGAIVEFLAEDEGKRDFILKALGGTIAMPPKRRHTRMPVHLPVEYRVRDTSPILSGVLTEISAGGALIATEPQPLPPLGSELIIMMVPPGGAAAMEILGKVSYHAGASGAGLKFSFRDGGGARRLRELIRRLRQS